MRVCQSENNFENWITTVLTVWEKGFSNSKINQIDYFRKQVINNLRTQTNSWLFYLPKYLEKLKLQINLKY